MTIRVFLLFWITRTLAWSFCPIYPIQGFSFRRENGCELLGLTFGYIPSMVQRLFHYFTQYLHPFMRSTLHHTKCKSKDFL